MASRITKKQLKQDELVDAAVDAGHWMEVHWRLLLRWAIGATVLVLAVVGWMAWSHNRSAQARDSLARGIAEYRQAEAGGFSDPSKLTGALALFEDSTGGVAAFYRGISLHHLGRAEEARQALEQALSEAEELPTLADTIRFTLPQIYAAEGKTDEAIRLLSELAGRSDGLVPADEVLLLLGRVQHDSGRTDEARQSWQRVLDEHPEGSAAERARQLLGRS